MQRITTFRNHTSGDRGPSQLTIYTGFHTNPIQYLQLVHAENLKNNASINYKRPKTKNLKKTIIVISTSAQSKKKIITSEVLKQTFRLGAVYDLDTRVSPSLLSSFLFWIQGTHKRVSV